MFRFSKKKQVQNSSPHIDVIPFILQNNNSSKLKKGSCSEAAILMDQLLITSAVFHLFMRLNSFLPTTIFASSLKQKIMKGTYINTVIMMAALSGRKNKKAANNQEIIRSLNDYKIIWSKNDKSSKPVANVSKSASIY